MALTIGQVAAAAGVNTQTIRYYERRGVLPFPRRTPSGYRQYAGDAVRRLRFIKRAQELGFSLAEIASLLKLEDGARRNVIRNVAGDRLQQIETKIADLQRMRKTLSHLIRECETTGASHPCPIIAALAGDKIVDAKHA